jgi:ZIP family zinc transporter
MGRFGGASAAVRAALSAVATGILVFLFWDVVSHGVEPVESHLEAHDWGAFAGYAALLGVGFAAGMMSLVYYDGWLKSKRSTPLVGPGAAAVDEFEHRSWFEALTPGRRLALLIATGIGLHNFGEGLAIGQSSAAGELSLALVLIIGFGLHNTTEGFGIVGPMSGEAERPSWRFLGLMGLIGGGPTFLGTVIGEAWVSPALEVVFFAVAGGSILYVVVQLFEVCRRFAMPTLVGWFLLLGLLLGFGTDWVLVAAGA